MPVLPKLIYLFLILDLLEIYDNRKTVEATNDIEGPVGKSRWYETIKPVTDEIIPKAMLTLIESMKVSVISFADAAGIINILRTNIIPTVWRALTTAKDKVIKNK